ncbi:MAG: PAS domain S-box protein [Nitrospirota bacterium]
MREHKKIKSGDENTELRSRAEKLVRPKTENAHPPRSREAMMLLVHDLEVHQVELEMQNEELHQARAALEASLEKYTDLYDFAPVGYFTLDRQGVISAANLSGSALLGTQRSRLIGRRFGQFVPAQDRPAFTVFLGTVFTSRGKETYEAVLMNKGALPLIVQIEAWAAPSAEECRIAVIDITERRRAEEALRESEARMYRLTEMAADAIIMLNDSGAVTFCNAAAERMFGCPGEEITDCDFHGSFIPERYRTAAKQGFDRFREQGMGPLINKTTEVTALRKDGTEFPLELSLSALRIKEEWHAIAIMRDITERKQLEKDIQNAREYAESIVQTVRRPLVVLNPDLKVISANQCFYSTFKAAPGETVGRSIRELGKRQWDIPRLRELLEGIVRDNTVFNSFEVEHDFPGIGRRIMLLNARRIFRKSIGAPSVLLAMEDITERKRAEERVIEVMRQQQAILDNIPNIAWLKDREGRYVAVNEPFGRRIGMAPKDLVGKSDRDIYPQELAEKYENDFREVMGSGTRRYFEETITDQDGTTRYLEKIETPFTDDAGTIIGIIGITHDITGRKEVEIKLRHDSTHDTLTGLYNRAFFEEELVRLAHSRRFPLSVVMADVNGLKTVNDTLGHEAGDELLRLAARVILRVFRAEDTVARIGGDEFVVLLPGTDKTVAEESVTRIMGCPEITGGLVSIAFGIAAAENKDQIAEALKMSDEMMYRNKIGQREP